MDVCMCDEYTYNPSASLLSSYYWYTTILTPNGVKCSPPIGNNDMLWSSGTLVSPSTQKKIGYK